MKTTKPNQKIRPDQEFPHSEAVSYAEEFGRHFTRDNLFGYVEKIKKIRVLVIGEAILDEYHFGHAIGKSAKEPTVALKFMQKEVYPGGSLAIANHLSNFCDEVGLLAMAGEKESQINLIKKSLNKNIKLFLFRKKNSPTITKKRFIEISPIQKLLEFYIINDSELSKAQSLELKRMLDLTVPKYNMVICADFGHGMIDLAARNTIAAKARFLAVTAQANAGNMGYHTISLYPKADYLCADEREIRLETRERNKGIPEIVKELQNRFSYKNLIITAGEAGCFLVQRNKIIRIPALVDKTIDRVGAGDAFLSITAPLIFSKAPAEVVGFIGNAVGAIAANIIGNERPVTKEMLYDFLNKTIGWTK
ncbi:MAG: PfkB family carbohydrate kinase [Patescibacteria group bacterium]